MKRFLSIISAVFCTTLMFGQNAEYQNLMAKAKAYEAYSKLVYALGTYYDAMEAEPTDQAAEAYDAFLNLENTIKNGNPGYGEFDEFDLHDGWKAILTEYETYWSEFAAVQFEFGTLTKGANNYEKVYMILTEIMITTVTTWRQLTEIHFIL